MTGRIMKMAPIDISIISWPNPGNKAGEPAESMAAKKKALNMP